MQRKVKLETGSMLNASQKSFLMTELANLTGWNGPLKKELPSPPPPRKPPYIRQWEHKVAMIAAKHKRENARYKARYNAAVADVRRAIHFGTPKEALAAIEKLTKEFA